MKHLVTKFLITIYLITIILICLFYVPFQIENTNYGPFADRNPNYYTNTHSNIFSTEGTIIYFRFFIYILIPAIILYLINKLITNSDK